MTENSETKINATKNEQSLDELKLLLEAVSKQSKIANLYWIGLAVFSISAIANIFVATSSNSYNKATTYTLPFNIASLESNYFIAMSLILSLLIIVFCIAHIQEQLASNYFHNTRKPIAAKLNIDEKQLKNIFDYNRDPTFCRVGPLSECIKTITKDKRLRGLSYLIVKSFLSIFYLFAPLAVLTSTMYYAFTVDISRLNTLWKIMAIALILLPIFPLIITFISATKLHCKTARKAYHVLTN